MDSTFTRRITRCLLILRKLKVEHSSIQANEIKTLMNEWIAELNLNGINMTPEMCVASFYAYLLRKNQ
jgi:hypothetical protein